MTVRGEGEGGEEEVLLIVGRREDEVALNRLLGLPVLTVLVVVIFV